MAWLKAYDWEKQKFPREQRISVRPEYRAGICKRLAESFGIPGVAVALQARSGAHAQPRLNKITLPMPSKPCPLAWIYHEVAHLLDHRQGGRGHRGSFRRTLIRVYCESKFRLPAICRAVKDDIDQERARAARQAAKRLREAERRAIAKARRRTPEFKMAALRSRIRRLEIRIKRLSTILGSARRSLAARERALQRRALASIAQVEVGKAAGTTANGQV